MNMLHQHVPLQGRIDRVTEEVPGSSPDGCTSPAPSWMLNFLPWINTTSNNTSCGQAGIECPSTLAGAAQASLVCPSSCTNSAAGAVAGCAGAALDCSAFVDASSAGLGTGSYCQASRSALHAAGAGCAGDAPGVMMMEHDVVLPGCPINGYPGKNKDNQQCIMCGECASVHRFPAVKHH